MAIEDPPSNSTSPRLSFSQDLIQPVNPFNLQKPTSSPNPDFNFNVGAVFTSAQDASPADELFSNGKILPMPIRNPNPNPNPDPIAAPVSEKSSGKSSLWKFGRSASLDCARTGMIKRMKFLRSYSAGSDPNRNPNPKPQSRANSNPNPNPKPPRTKGREKRIGPVPIFPKERGVIGFLLCNCVGRGNNKISRGMDYYYSP